MSSNNKWIKYGPRAICGKYKKIKNYDQNRKDHAYYKRLEKQAEYEVQIGKFKGRRVILKSSGGKIETYRKYFPKKMVGEVSTANVMRLDTMVLLVKHSRLEKPMKKRKRKWRKFKCL